MRALLAVGLLGLGLAGGVDAARTDAPVVSVQGGKVAGVSEPGLNVFRGIPYAAPPVGDLRWRDPQPVKPWIDVRDATRFSASCTQGPPVPAPPYTAGFLIAGPRSEDCLYLNIWTPSKSAGKRPVYVFIHGGAFQAGGGDVPAYNGSALARRGAVVVSINYRLGMLGFFAHPALSKESPRGTSGNYGVMDVIAALRWVQDNIARFGGDPALVTVAGQSAGAGMVNMLLGSPLAEGLFQRAIMESGPVLGIPMLPLSAAEASGVASVAKAKVAGIDGLRAIPAADLTQKALAGLPLPIIDGKAVPANPESFGTRLISKVPVIIGYNRDESGTEATPVTVAAFDAEVKKRFGTLADRVLQLYPHATPAEAARSSAQLNRDRRVAGLILWSERRKVENLPVYAYHFERVFPGPGADLLGAFHSSELPYVFGALHIPETTFTGEDHRISSEIQDRWLAFMRTGNPSPNKRARWARLDAEPTAIWRIAPRDSLPLMDPARLALFRDFQARGGTLGLL